ncbi:MAG: GTPase Era [Flavobacteriales bacterium]
MIHKAGFINIIGKPNVGKSTLMNQLVGTKLSIINSKAQTTRHRIMGIVNDDDYQLIFSDTPGVVDAKYKLHEGMNNFVKSAFQDADVFLFVVEINEKPENQHVLVEKLAQMEVPVILVLNKIDNAQQEDIKLKVSAWTEKLPKATIIPISALHKFNVDIVLKEIIEFTPESPAYFPKDELTDKPMRFFVSEIIREKIMTHYKQEIPYSSEVEVESYVNEKKIVKISAVIYVMRESQKGIIIGKGGVALKRVGTEARRDIERFIDKKVFLQLFVKVDKDWRDDPKKLKRYGYLD